ncbi:hypothetical protein LGK97_15730 [Clostridium sp. CS001]|uniref:hypothetical protein n=1 Tax=Clostridium sp. CS001 TaxID=2880648 RepID=UPI001CF57BA7|nr:hypothetical protein [Clostridium sp. CS001]MCB2291180.1 hypothetical protein [Clostridium sp. CS001]
MWIFYAAFILLVSLVPLLFLVDYYVFFWGNYIYNLIAGFGFLITALIIIKNDVVILRKRRKQNNNPIKDSINKRFKNKRKEKNLKSTKTIVFDLICSIAIIGMSTIFFEQIYTLSIDLPNIINKDYVKASVEVIESVKASSKGDHHTQYIIAEDLDTNDIIEIEFRHKYGRILKDKHYDIWYLPHSHLGYRADIIK